MANIRDFRNTLTHKIVNGVENADLLHGLIDFDRMNEEMIHLNSHVWENKAIRAFKICRDLDGKLWIELCCAPDPLATQDLSLTDDFDCFPDWVYDETKKEWKDPDGEFLLPSHLFTSVYAAICSPENVRQIEYETEELEVMAVQCWIDFCSFRTTFRDILLPLVETIQPDAVKYHMDLERVSTAKVFDWISIYDAPIHFDHALQAMIQRILLDHPMLIETDLAWTAYMDFVTFRPTNTSVQALTGKYPTNNTIWNFANAALDAAKGWYDQE